MAVRFTLFYNTFITVLYMFRATPCSSSGGTIVLIQHLLLSLSVSGCPVYFILQYVYYSPLHVSSNAVLIIRSNCTNTASGIVTFCKWPSRNAGREGTLVTYQKTTLFRTREISEEQRNYSLFIIITEFKDVMDLNYDSQASLSPGEHIKN